MLRGAPVMPKKFVIEVTESTNQIDGGKRGTFVIPALGNKVEDVIGGLQNNSQNRSDVLFPTSSTKGERRRKTLRKSIRKPAETRTVVWREDVTREGCHVG